MKDVKKDPPVEFDLGGSKVRFERWTVARPGEALTETVPQRDSLAEDAVAFYSQELLVGSREGRLGCLLPYAEVRRGEDSFSDAFVEDRPIITHAIDSIEWQRRNAGVWSVLARYAYLRLGLNPKTNNVQTHLCGLDHHGEMWSAVVGPGVWSGARSSMDAGAVVIEKRDGDSPELSLLAEVLLDRFGRSVTVREAMTKNFGKAVEFGAARNQYSLGVCSVIYCEGDGKFVITRRARGVHINTGLVCAASGAVPWACVDVGSPSLFGAVDAGMAICHRKEIGVGDFRIVRTGFARELTRQGSPEFFFTVYFKGTSAGAVQIIAQNDDPDAEQVDGYVYAFSPESATAMLNSTRGTEVVQRKGMVNLHFSMRHLTR